MWGASLRLGARARVLRRQPGRAGSPRGHAGEAARGTRVTNDGLWLAAAKTERAPDTEEIDVPAGHKQRIGCAQRGRTHLSPTRRGRDAGSHVTSQPRAFRAYSVHRHSALPDPADPGLGHRVRGPVLAITPGPARAVLVVPLAAGQADHGSIVPFRRAGCVTNPRFGRWRALAPGQAALARRIRRRRSADRSSSLSPPQVPYFSGRPTA